MYLKRIFLFVFLLFSVRSFALPALEAAPVDSPDYKQLYYPAMAKALKAKIANVRTILVLPVVGNKLDEVIALTVQGSFARALVATGYYVIPPAVSNAFFASQGLNFGTDVRNIPLRDLLDKTGADAVLYLDAARGETDNSWIVGNIIKIDVRGKLITYGDLPIFEFRHTNWLKLTDGINGTEGFFEMLAKLIVTTVNAAETDENHVKVSYFVQGHPIFQTTTRLPAQALHGLSLGPYGFKYATHLCFGHNLSKSDLKKENYQYRLYLPNCDTKADQVFLYYVSMDMASPEFWGLNEFPAEVLEEAQEYRKYLKSIGVNR